MKRAFIGLLIFCCSSCALANCLTYIGDIEKVEVVFAPDEYFHYHLTNAKLLVGIGELASEQDFKIYRVLYNDTNHHNLLALVKKCQNSSYVLGLYSKSDTHMLNDELFFAQLIAHINELFNAHIKLPRRNIKTNWGFYSQLGVDTILYETRDNNPSISYAIEYYAKQALQRFSDYADPLRRYYLLTTHSKQHGYQSRMSRSNSPNIRLNKLLQPTFGNIKL